MTLWEELAKKTNPPKFHIIFEDDAILEPNFVDLLNKWYTDTKGFKNMNFVHLYVFEYQSKERNIEKYKLQKTFPGLAGLQCYIVRHSFITKLTTKIKPMFTAIDEQVTRLKIKSYFIYDDFVTHGQIKSENKYVYM